ncbi:aconitate hydratase [Ferroacidibacillus organovorans]|uniref:Aconitate hydratase n=1 Tax=Ferroacidibacillus organovorans TaxID=1765683 RepID=A0A853K9V0_9BACL|nr:aconitate hydratase [Ferroacidibacillus organovorans]OAG93122.1 aconitate hydratase [Ferroacidibacillus organovorans]
MVTTHNDPFHAKQELQVGDRSLTYYRLEALVEQGVADIKRLPFSMKVLLESVLRKYDGYIITEDHIRQLANWNAKNPDETKEVPFMPARILLQDFTGVPVVVDLAALRQAMHRLGGDPKKINPLVPVDLVIDHSVQVDRFGDAQALETNEELEFQRNEERYKFLHWATKAFQNFRAVPPSTGIVHQVNLEYLASVVQVREENGEWIAYPDSLVGTDSHTTMINGLGVLGWGVGGIEAEAGMLGQPLYFVTPHVVGFKLTGKLPEGSTATDLALTVTNLLRKKGVVGKFVEYFGPGLSSMTLADRATIANMAPEYGATMGFFPVDAETLSYLRATGRSEELIETVEAYTRAQGLFRTDDMEDPIFSDVVELDLATVVPSLAGPKRPQDRVELTAIKQQFEEILHKPVKEGGFGVTPEKASESVAVQMADGQTATLRAGSLVIAAITSCTNTSNPSVMIAAGILAKNAVKKGLRRQPHVKTSLGPGSRVVTQYLEDGGYMPYLETLGFQVVGYGCTTCIGNSGPLNPEIEAAIRDHELTVGAVLSGNRNFEGRIHPLVKANYLASPPLVVAYALTGRLDIDLTKDPLGFDQNGNPVYLKDVWPSSREVEDAIASLVTPAIFKAKYENVLQNNPRFNALPSPTGERYSFEKDSTYIQEPPFFEDLENAKLEIKPIERARILALLGDSVTTDHISPAGAINPKSPAGQFLQEKGVEIKNFNSYGSRRGNHEVMMRGTFANVRIRNEMIPGTEGGFTEYLPTGETLSIYDAAMNYQGEKQTTVIFAGKEYGTGSSRDWAAKGTYLLGVKAVIAESFERIHRSNLVGMGVLPIQFDEGMSWKSLGLTGKEYIEIQGLDDHVKPQQRVTLRVTAPDGGVQVVDATVRLDSPIEIDYYRNGGILQMVLRNLLKKA